jgi:hypothetical protein
MNLISSRKFSTTSLPSRRGCPAAAGGPAGQRPGRDEMVTVNLLPGRLDRVLSLQKLFYE